MLPDTVFTWYSSVFGIVAATTFLVSGLKRLLGNVSGFNSVPTWLYAVLVSAGLTALAATVLGTLEGNMWVLINQAVIQAAAASGAYEWFTNSTTTSLRESLVATRHVPDSDAPPPPNNTPIGVLVLLLVPALTLSACGKTIPTITAQAGLGLAQTIGQAQQTNRTLVDLNLPNYSPELGLKVQERLTQANDTLKPLPDLLRVIEAAQGQPASNDVERALVIVTLVSDHLSLTLRDVPVADVTRQLTEAVREALKTTAAIRKALDEIRASAGPRPSPVQG